MAYAYYEGAYTHIQCRHFRNPSAYSPLHGAVDSQTFQMLESLPRDIEIVVYCAVGYRSGWLARALALNGMHLMVMFIIVGKQATALPSIPSPSPLLIP